MGRHESKPVRRVSADRGFDPRDGGELAKAQAWAFAQFLSTHADPERRAQWGRLAARIWSNDHKDIFPPDFITMKDGMNTPRILFCPADTAALRVTEWSELNPSLISYRFLNPNGSDLEPNKVLTLCPIHGHVGLSDGSVQKK